MNSNQDLLANGLIRYCNLTRAIRELASQPDINNYHCLKRMLVTSTSATIGELLISACRMGVIRDVELILPTAVVHDLTTQMHESFCVAAMNCHLAIMNLLLQHGVDINYNNQVALRKAVSSGCVESVQFLLNNGADVHHDNDKLLLLCCQSGDYNDVVGTLIENGIDVFKHYHETYDCCLKQNREKCGVALIKYSCRALESTKNSITYVPQEHELLQDYYECSNSDLVNNNEEDGSGDYYLIDSEGDMHHVSDVDDNSENQSLARPNSNIAPSNLSSSSDP